MSHGSFVRVPSSFHRTDIPPLLPPTQASRCRWVVFSNLSSSSLSLLASFNQPLTPTGSNLSSSNSRATTEASSLTLARQSFQFLISLLDRKEGVGAAPCFFFVRFALLSLSLFHLVLVSSLASKYTFLSIYLLLSFSLLLVRAYETNLIIMTIVAKNRKRR